MAVNISLKLLLLRSYCMDRRIIKYEKPVRIALNKISQRWLTTVIDSGIVLQNHTHRIKIRIGQNKNFSRDFFLLSMVFFTSHHDHYQKLLRYYRHLVPFCIVPANTLIVTFIHLFWSYFHSLCSVWFSKKILFKR